MDTNSRDVVVQRCNPADLDSHIYHAHITAHLGVEIYLLDTETLPACSLTVALAIPISTIPLALKSLPSLEYLSELRISGDKVWDKLPDTRWWAEPGGLDKISTTSPRKFSRQLFLYPRQFCISLYQRHTQPTVCGH
jgi:hypothetical protein